MFKSNETAAGFCKEDSDSIFGKPNEQEITAPKQDHEKFVNEMKTVTD